MTEKETFKMLASETGLSQKQVREVVHLYNNLIRDEIRNGNKYVVIGLGSFYQRTWHARKGHNPLTGEKLDIPAKQTIGFKPSQTFVDELNKK